MKKNLLGLLLLGSLCQVSCSKDEEKESPEVFDIIGYYKGDFDFSGGSPNESMSLLINSDSTIRMYFTGDLNQYDTTSSYNYSGTISKKGDRYFIPFGEFLSEWNLDKEKKELAGSWFYSNETYADVENSLSNRMRVSKVVE